MTVRASPGRSLEKPVDETGAALLVCAAPILREALVSFATANDTNQAPRVVGCVYESVRECEDVQPAAVVIDMEVEHALQALNYFISHRCSAPVVALTATPSEAEVLGDSKLQRLTAVARNAPAEVLRHVISQVLQRTETSADARTSAVRDPRKTSYARLTRREAEIAELLVQSNKAIANSKCISEKTVKNHVNKILEKTGTRNRREAYTLLQAMNAYMG